MIDIEKLRKTQPNIIGLGVHAGIYQSILDFDYISGKNEPSLKLILSSNKKYERFFWGDREILIPVYKEILDIPKDDLGDINLFISTVSERRTLSIVTDVIENIPNIMGGSIFAENIPEKHSLELYKKVQEKNVFVIGPSSVGLIVPNHIKLGAIGGITADLMTQNKLFHSGNCAVFSSSSGMTNEIIHLLAQHDKNLSFGITFGGDLFPILTPDEAFLAAENDPNTEYIVYFGELGGQDEYKIAELVKNKKVTKKVIAYIAGSISEMFETPPQFGHAKAIAAKGEESASAKRKILEEARVQVASSFSQFVEFIKNIESKSVSIKNDVEQKDFSDVLKKLSRRKKALFINTISGEKDSQVNILNNNLIDFAKNKSFAYMTISMLLGKEIKSEVTEKLSDFILKICIDHGPYVSGAVNTMITARAGKDLVSSLAAGLLTIGPRFGGAINYAAENWLNGVDKNISAENFIENYAKDHEPIPGIGHKKYRLDNPDPRVKELLNFKSKLTNAVFTNYALEVEKKTTAKRGNLILNVDGTIAALLLDVLVEKEGYSYAKLKELVNAEFFNALFILSRSVGFTAHYLDQKRIDEGLFRLSDEEVETISA